MGLVITRKAGESCELLIGSERVASVKVVRVEGNRVRIRIEAPATVRVLRDELIDRDRAAEPPRDTAA